MEVTKNVILDLLPLYLANEASDDSRILIEKYLETDPEMVSMMEQSTALDLPADIPISLSEENKMEAYKEAKKYIFWRTVILVGAVSLTLLALVAFGTLAAFFLISS
jgi:hypothetical protein